MKALVPVALVLLTTACGADERAGLAGAQPDAAADALPDAPLGDAEPPIRSVELRNPFGSADPDNLLVDGDFELTSSSGQFGWTAIEAGAQANLKKETGGLCRSGVTCAVLTPEANLVASAVRPASSDIEIVVWGKPPSNDCTLTVVSLIQCTSPFAVSAADVPPTKDAPDPSGWCEYRAVAPAMEHRPCLFLTSFEAPEQKTIIDAASLSAAPPTKPRSIRAGPPRAEIAARAERAVRVLRDNVRLGRPPPAKP